MPSRFDLVVIGAGAAGLAAAITGSRLGASVALVHDGPVGGDCTFAGCVPSKTLLEAAARGAGFTDAMAAVRREVEAAAHREAALVGSRRQITLVPGRARFLSPRTVEADGTVLGAERFVVATGARPAVGAIDGLDQAGYLTTRDVFALEHRPERLVVLGAGPTGCELAQAFAQLGSKVSLVEAADRVLPREEPETSATIADALAADGVAVLTGRRAVRAGRRHGHPTLSLDGSEVIEADELLLAAGVVPDTAGLGLDAAGVETAGGYVATDGRLATTMKGIWAAGDVTGRMAFAHAADEMGRVAATNALGRTRRSFRSGAIPWVTFTAPEVGRVGMTEAEAEPLGARVAFLPMTEVDRAIVSGDTRGFVKLVAAPRRPTGWLGGGKLVGASVVACRGGEVVHEAALAIRTGMLVWRLASMVHAYPTWSTALRQAAVQFFVEIDGRRARPARRP